MRTQQTAVPLPGIIVGKVTPKVVLLAALVERFLPHVEAVLEPRLKTGIIALMTLITDRAQEIRDLLASIEDGTAPAARIKAFSACGVGLTPRTFEALKKKVVWSVSDAVECASFTLVLGWLDMFPKGTRGADTEELDGSMMLPLDAEARRKFALCCERICMSEEEVRDILRIVRVGLPEGERLPDEAAQLLDASIITIRR